MSAGFLSQFSNDQRLNAIEQHLNNQKCKEAAIIAVDIAKQIRTYDHTTHSKPPDYYSVPHPLHIGTIRPFWAKEIEDQ
jgi:hypothetical protein